MSQIEFKICSKNDLKSTQGRKKAVDKIFVHSFLVSIASNFYLFAVLLLTDWNGVFAKYLYSLSSCAFGLTILLSFLKSSKMDAEILTDLTGKGQFEETVYDAQGSLIAPSIPLENFPIGQTVVFIHTFEENPECENF